jgi:beta-galactosidase
MWHDDKLSSPTKWNVAVANNPDFIGSIVDRVQRLVLGDKNRPSAVIWSMGNESGYGCGFELALEWTKRYDPGRLTHYESAQYVDTDRKYDYSNLDLWSEMYASLEFMDEYLAKVPDKPFIQCEYSHAMGNGPGDLEDYFRKFQSDDRFCGGFVWEFCDHAIYKGVAPNGKAMYFYGGDSDERVHDGNFCMDGLVYPDRRPHTGMLEFKNVNRPARAAFDQENGVLTLRNYLAFTDLRDYLEVSYVLTKDGVTVTEGRVEELPSVAPGCAVDMPFAVSVPAAGKCYLRFIYTAKHTDLSLEAGHELGFDEFLLANVDGRNQDAMPAPTVGTALTVEEDDAWATVRGENFTYIYNKRTGLWQSMEIGNCALLEKPMELNIWRAPTDNDRIVKSKWMLAKFHMSAARAYESAVMEEDGAVIIENTMSIGALTTRPKVRMTTTWKVYPSGRVDMHMDARKDPTIRNCPGLVSVCSCPRAWKM